MVGATPIVDRVYQQNSRSDLIVNREVHCSRGSGAGQPVPRRAFGRANWGRPARSPGDRDEAPYRSPMREITYSSPARPRGYRGQDLDMLTVFVILYMLPPSPIFS